LKYPKYLRRVVKLDLEKIDKEKEIQNLPNFDNPLDFEADAEQK